MRKQSLHLCIGSGVLGAILGAFGMRFDAVDYWFIFLPVLVWYMTKPSNGP